MAGAKYYKIYLRERTGNIDQSEIVPENLNHDGLVALGFELADVIKSAKQDLTAELLRITDGTDFVVSEKDGIIFDKIWLNKTQLEAMQAYNNVLTDIVLIDENDLSAFSWSYGMRISQKTLTESGSLTSIEMTASKVVDSNTIIGSLVRITGTILSGIEEPIEGATVEIVQANGGIVLGLSIADGTYELEFVSDGDLSATIEASKTGYVPDLEELEVTDIVITQDFKLAEE
jgi:hypothetical protein